MSPPQLKKEERSYGKPPVLLCPSSRNVIQIVFMNTSFRNSCVSLNMHRQAIPVFITDVLLEGNTANILGDGGGGAVLVAAGCLSPQLGPRPAAYA